MNVCPQGVLRLQYGFMRKIHMGKGKRLQGTLSAAFLLALGGFALMAAAASAAGSHNMPSIAPGDNQTAETAAAAQPLEVRLRQITFKEAVGSALAKNLELALARAEEEVARCRARAVVGRALPAIELGGGYRSRNGRIEGSFGGLENVYFTTFRSEAGVVLRLNIGKQIHDVYAAARELDATVLKRLDTQQQILLRVYELYQNLILAKTGVSIAEALVDDMQQFVRITTARQAAGVGSGSETARARARLAAARWELVDEQKIRKAISVRLAVVLRKDPGVLLDPAEGQAAPIFHVAFPGTGDAVASARQRPDVRAARESLAMAAEQTSSARWNLFAPELILDASQNYIGDEASEMAARSEYGAYLAWEFSLEKLQRIRQQRAEKKAARLQVQKAEEMAVGEVTAARQDIRAAREQIPLARDEMHAAQESLRISLSRYKASTAIALEVFDAQAMLAQARLNLAKSHLFLNLSRVRLLAAAGVLDRTIFWPAQAHE